MILHLLWVETTGMGIKMWHSPSYWLLVMKAKKRRTPAMLFICSSPENWIQIKPVTQSRMDRIAWSYKRGKSLMNMSCGGPRLAVHGQVHLIVLFTCISHGGFTHPSDDRVKAKDVIHWADTQENKDNRSLILWFVRQIIEQFIILIIIPYFIPNAAYNRTIYCHFLYECLSSADSPECERKSFVIFSESLVRTKER